MRRAFLTLLAAAAACSGGLQRQPRTEGERMYLAKCTGCHSAYEPRDHSPKSWESEVAEMERQKRVRLTQEERALILGYLTGTEPPPPSAISR